MAAPLYFYGAAAFCVILFLTVRRYAAKRAAAIFDRIKHSILASKQLSCPCFYALLSLKSLTARRSTMSLTVVFPYPREPLIKSFHYTESVVSTHLGNGFSSVGNDGFAFNQRFPGSCNFGVFHQKPIFRFR